MTLLPELLNCHEYVNADAIAEKKIKIVMGYCKSNNVG
ncbi:hypothetical protein CbuG_1572 [Coxiella burnetii CbuG_Q212]|nr:hypothetical protein CbuG_1572 [Coxiella burnetii CbuG_Q212]